MLGIGIGVFSVGAIVIYLDVVKHMARMISSTPNGQLGVWMCLLGMIVMMVGAIAERKGKPIKVFKGNRPSAGRRPPMPKSRPAPRPMPMDAGYRPNRRPPGPSKQRGQRIDPDWDENIPDEEV